MAYGLENTVYEAGQWTETDNHTSFYSLLPHCFLDD